MTAGGKGPAQAAGVWCRSHPAHLGHYSLWAAVSNFFISQHTKIIYILPSGQKIGILLIHSNQRAIVGLAVVIFFIDGLREKRSVPPTK